MSVQNIVDKMRNALDEMDKPTHDLEPVVCINKTPTIGTVFESGAYRDGQEGKLDFEGFLSPVVLEEFAKYMHKNRLQSNGVLRDSDNWQAGIPKTSYMKSGWRHFFDWWKEHRGLRTKDGIRAALCGVIFNAMGYLFELCREDDANAAEAERRGG